MKICVLGCGLRTPLLVHGLVHSDTCQADIVLYDIDEPRARLMTDIGCTIAHGTASRIRMGGSVESALDGSDFVISSVRVGDMKTRASDERLAVECGFAGQETTGPAGFAMALRTIPVALAYARLVERLAPAAWIVNFTNPAGIVTQAISTLTGAKVIGICDTPAELMHQVERTLDVPPGDLRCDYFGLNHLGWIRSVRVRGEERIDALLDNPAALRRLYPAELFAPELLAAIRLLPTEYVFFHYNQHAALRNQQRNGATRGEELQSMNGQVWRDLAKHAHAGDPASALAAYRAYLNRRNASYMRLEGAGESALTGTEPDWDPFEGATGYHRIAVQAIRALSSQTPEVFILNVPNRGCVEGLAPDDIVEVPCVVDRNGARPISVGRMPDAVRGLVIAMKYSERLTVQAASERRWDTALLALTMNPIVGNWEASRQFLSRLFGSEPDTFSAFTRREVLQPAYSKT